LSAFPYSHAFPSIEFPLLSYSWAGHTKMDARASPNVSVITELGKISQVRSNGGLGSSHTAPCGTAVPARPPTHRLNSLESPRNSNNGPMAPANGVPGS